MYKAWHALVSGRVQGVYYRQSTREQAQRLGLAGWVRNLPDGRVELVAEGEAEALQQLADWLAQGPSEARVSAVALTEQPLQGLKGFSIRD